MNISPPPFPGSTPEKLAPVVAIANVKGGVGKSTIILLLAEALAFYEGFRVLVIDSDPQTSASVMLAPSSHLDHLSHAQRTFPDYLMKSDEVHGPDDFENYIRHGVSDLRGLRNISLIPSDIRLALLEKELTRHRDSGEVYIQNAVRAMLDYARRQFDIVLIDCPAGLSLLNDTWLQLTDFHMTPVKPDYLSVLAMNILDQSIEIARNRGQRVSERLGIAINMKPAELSDYDQKWIDALTTESHYKAFPVHVPLSGSIREATELSMTSRDYKEKYPGDLHVLAELFMSSFLERLFARVEAG